MTTDRIKKDLENYNNSYNSVVATINQKQELAAKTEQELAQLSAQANQLQGAILGLQNLLTEESEDDSKEEVTEEIAPQN